MADQRHKASIEAVDGLHGKIDGLKESAARSFGRALDRKAQGTAAQVDFAKIKALCATWVDQEIAAHDVWAVAAATMAWEKARAEELPEGDDIRTPERETEEPAAAPHGLSLLQKLAIGVLGVGRDPASSSGRWRWRSAPAWSGAAGAGRAHPPRAGAGRPPAREAAADRLPRLDQRQALDLPAGSHDGGLLGRRCRQRHRSVTRIKRGTVKVMRRISWSKGVAQLALLLAVGAMTVALVGCGSTEPVCQGTKQNVVLVVSTDTTSLANSRSLAPTVASQVVQRVAASCGRLLVGVAGSRRSPTWS